jgi:MFS family permease
VRHRFDPVGVLLASAALSALAYGLVEGQRHGWGRVAGLVTIPGILAAAGALLVLFVLWERRQPEPLLPLALFRNRAFTVATLLALVSSFALFGLLLVYVLQTQVALGMSPLASGLTALPWTVTLSAVAPVAGRLADRTGGRVLLAGGLLLLAAGALGVAFVPTTTATAGTFVLPLVVVGAGIGLTVAPTTTEAMRAVAPAQAGAASGVLNTARQVGAVVGTAVTGAVLQNRLTAALHREPARAALLAASRPALAVVAAVVLLGVVLALLLPGRRPVALPAATQPAAAQPAATQPAAAQPAGAAPHDIDTVPA